MTEFFKAGKYYAGYSEILNVEFNDFYTDETNRGQLVIKRFDEVNQIISGTFWFDAKNKVGKIVQIREGRFDMSFVR